MSDTVTLSPDDYWRLVAVGLRCESTVARALAARDAVTREIAQRYPDFEPDGAGYDADDASHTLTRRP